ncbi:MAG: arginase family protein [Candidatus Pacebacteria bacterium]|nr:arginase family protein [Candidatus Paceibacterota bacterium]MBP9851854.1 arginase family protein [Candidatus Paceibacterota bacterium]
MKNERLQKLYLENRETFAAFDLNGQALGNNLYGLPHTFENAILHVHEMPTAITVSGTTGAEDGPAGLAKGSKSIELTSEQYRDDAWIPGMWANESDPELHDLHKKGREIFDEMINSNLDHVVEYNVRLLDEICEKVNFILERNVTESLKLNRLVAVIGGCHGSIFGSVKAHSKFHKKFSILTVDAHLDLRLAYEGVKWSHASIMRNILTEIPQVKHLTSVGIRSTGADERQYVKENKDRISVFYDSVMRNQMDLQDKNWARWCFDIVDSIPTDDVYISFDHDGLEVSLCPSTGTPVAGGLSMWQAKKLITTLVSMDKRIIGFDLNEMVPTTQNDRNSAAELFYHMYYCMMVSQGILKE